MQVLYDRCAGLDVHAQTVVACVRVGTGAQVRHEVRTFGTGTGELLRLGEWLAAEQCTHAVMESTGVYWKPVWHLLEGTLTLLLANALQVRAVPGRKTDVNDATWLADLLAHGLIHASFVPPTPIQELRDLTRTRKQLVREIAQHTLRIQKVLEDANIKLAHVLSDVLGQSGRAILAALIAGETDPDRLAALAHGRLKSSPEARAAALRGHVTVHHRFLLRLHLDQVVALESAVATLDARLTEALAPFRPVIDHLVTMPGVSTTVASVLLAEIGPDMSRFPSPGHLVSWAGLAPRVQQSAGKRLSSATRPGDPWLKTTLVQAAWGAVRTNDSYYRAQFARLRSRRGAKKAIVAVAASLLTAAYYMLARDQDHHDLGPHYLDHRASADVARGLIRRLERLGLEVHVQPAA
jgi:transposase